MPRLRPADRGESTQAVTPHGLGEAFPKAPPPTIRQQGGKSPVFLFFKKFKKSAAGARQAQRVRPVGRTPVGKAAPQCGHVVNLKGCPSCPHGGLSCPSGRVQARCPEVSSRGGAGGCHQASNRPPARSVARTDGRDRGPGHFTCLVTRKVCLKFGITFYVITHRRGRHAGSSRCVPPRVRGPG